MANLTPEQQAKVDTLMRKAKALYEAIQRAKIPTAVAVALRDGLGFDKLNDEGITAIAVATVEYEKGLAELLTKLAATPTPEAPSAPEKAPDAPAEKTPITPEVMPPASRGARAAR